MKTKENIKLITVGRLVKELSRFEKKCSDYDVACWAPDYLTCCVRGHRLDEDGDVCIHFEMQEDDGGYFTVEMLLADLASYDENARVYMESCGYYLNFEADGDIFTESEDDEIVGCHANAFGEYDEPTLDEGDINDADRRYLEEKHREEKREDRTLTVIMIALMILLMFWMGRNIAAIVTHSCDSVVGNIIWIIICAVLLAINVLTLHYSKEK